MLPSDLVAGRLLRPTPSAATLDGVEVPDGWMGLDVGPQTAAAYAGEIAAAATVFWNGPMGAFELEPFAAGTRAVAEAVAEAEATTVVGGGDSRRGARPLRAGRPRHPPVDRGRGALELLEGATLPGVEALDDA